MSAMYTCPFCGNTSSNVMMVGRAVTFQTLYLDYKRYGDKYIEPVDAVSMIEYDDYVPIDGKMDFFCVNCSAVLQDEDGKPITTIKQYNDFVRRLNNEEVDQSS